MVLLRQLDLVVAALALAVFLGAGLPVLGWVTAVVLWLAQRGIQTVLTRRAVATRDPRTVVGLMTGSMIGRGWLVAGGIFAVGLSDNSTGLAAAVMVIVLFTVYFTTSIVMRPFDAAPTKRARPERPDALGTGGAQR